MDQEVNDGAEGVDVAPGRMARSFGRLPEIRPGGIVRGEVQGRVAKVAEHDVGVRGGGVGAEEDVARLHVAVGDASPVRVGTSRVEASVEELEGGEYLPVYVPDERFRQVCAMSPVPIDQLVQVAAGAVFEIVARAL